MELFTMVAAWVGEWATVKGAETLLTGVKNRWYSNEVDEALKTAIVSAQEAEPKLFFRCNPDGHQGFPQFLAQFFKDAGLRELQKPLNDQGLPDVEYLVEAFNRDLINRDLKHLNNRVNKESARPWMQVLVNKYVEEINGIAFRVTKRDYLDRLTNCFAHFDLSGIDFGGTEQIIDQPKRVENIFIVPFLEAESTQRSDEITSHQQANQSKKQEKSVRKIPADQLFKDNQTRRALLLGVPGSGKTALVSYFVLKLCEHIQNPTDVGLSSDIDWLPIVIRMRELAHYLELSILEFVKHFAEKDLSCSSLPQGFFEYWLKNGRAIILLDGLDEVPKEKISKIIEKIKAFLGGQYTQNRVLVTSRPIGNPGQYFQQEFSRYEIQLLHQGQISYFIHCWYQNSGLDKAEAERCEFNVQKALQDNDRVNLLAKNPLLLTIILLIHREQAQLPKERCDLYDCAIETLLRSWDEAKAPADHKVLDHLRPNDLRWLMARLAYWIHTQETTDDQTGVVSRDDLIQQLSKYIQDEEQIPHRQAKEEAKRFLDQVVRDRAGLLSNQGNGYYAFVHRTFQEYLAAEDLRNRIEEQKEQDDFESLLLEVKSHLHKAHWREVILLLVAQLDGEKAGQLIRTIFQKNSEYEQWLHRDLLFAGYCLVENPKRLGRKEKDARMVTDILTRLVQLEASDGLRTWCRTRQQVSEIFLSLSGTDVAEETLRILNSYSGKVSSDNLLMYRLALGKHKEFINDLLLLLKDEKTSSEAVKILEKVARYSNVSEFLIRQLLSVFRGELVIARILSSLGYRSEWLDYLLEYDGYDESLRYQAHEKYLTEGLEAIHTKLDPLLNELQNGSILVVDELIKNWLFCDEYGISNYVAEELGKVSGASQIIELKLLEKLQCESEWGRGEIAQALGYLSNPSDEVVQALVKLLCDDEDVFVRANAAEALGNLDRAHDFVLTQLLNSLRDIRRLDSSDEWDLSGYSSVVFKALVQLSKAYSLVAPELADWIEQHQDWECFEDAVDALWEILEE